MLAAKKQQPRDLAADIHAHQALIEAFIDQRVAVLKASADGAGQPVQALRTMLTRGLDKRCLCSAALLLLEKEQ